MFTSVEFFCGLLMGLVLSLSLYYKIYNQLNNINQKLETIIQAIGPGKFKVKSKSAKLLSERKYLEDIEDLWKNFKNLFDKKSGLDSDYSFNKLATEIRELREEKGVAASTLKSFYQRKTNPRKRTLEAIQEWIDKNKETVNEDVSSNNNDM